MHRNQEGIVLTQLKYIHELLARANFENCKSVITPMAVTEKLTKTLGDPLSVAEGSKYKSIVGALQYLTLTRPDIAFSVNKVCQFLHSPIAATGQ